MMHDTCPWWRCGLHVGGFLALLFVVCFSWPYFRAVSPAVQTLHQTQLQLAFLGWSGMNAVSFILGLVQAFIWGFIAVGVWNLAGLLTGHNHHCEE